MKIRTASLYRPWIRCAFLMVFVLAATLASSAATAVTQRPAAAATAWAVPEGEHNGVADTGGGTVTVDYVPGPSATPSPSPTHLPPHPRLPPAPVHLVRGFDGMCMRDTGDSAAPRTKIVDWACDPTAGGQQWSPP